MEGIAVERVTQRHRTGKRGDKWQLVFCCERQGGKAGRRADVAKQCKDVVSNQFSGVFSATVRLVAVIKITDFNQALADTTLRVDLVKIDLGALVKLNAQLSRRASKRG